MRKVYDNGRLAVKIDDGTDKGFDVKISSLTETYDQAKLESVSEAIATLTDGKVEEVRASQTYVYRKNLEELINQ